MASCPTSASTGSPISASTGSPTSASTGSVTSASTGSVTSATGSPTSASTGSPTVVAVLAAGAGSRFAGAGHKLAAELDGVPIADLAVGAALAAGIGPVIVVTGAHVPELPTLADAIADGRVVRIANADWADGQSTSLQAAVREAERRDAGALIVGLADQPFVDPATWRAVASSASPIAVADYGEGPRNPVRLDRSVWSLLPREGDHGARHLISLRPDLVEQVPCAGSPADIDTLEELRSWQNRSSTNSR